MTATGWRFDDTSTLYVLIDTCSCPFSRLIHLDELRDDRFTDGADPWISCRVENLLIDLWVRRPSCVVNGLKVIMQQQMILNPIWTIPHTPTIF
jgi:hypothetical protein